MDYKTVKGPENVVTIKVVGVGGAGNNVVNRMIKEGTDGVDFVAINTDKQALSVSNADLKIQIGEKSTKGQGAGSDPDVGKRAADESRSNIAKALENTDMVFITAGEGGGTGTGAAPIVAEIAKEAGILTVAVVTKPFQFEGRRRMDQANAGIRELQGKVDALLIIPNDRLKFATDQKITLSNAFEIADDVLHNAVSSISNLIKSTGFINLDFADVTTIMKNAGFAHMGVGHATGKNKAEDAAKLAIASPLMETSIDGASGVLINIVGSEDMTLEDVESAASLIQQSAKPDANIIFGASFDDKLTDEIQITVIATGFDSKPSSVIDSTTDFQNVFGSAGKSNANPSVLPIFGSSPDDFFTPVMPTYPSNNSQQPSSSPVASVDSNPLPVINSSLDSSIEKKEIKPIVDDVPLAPAADDKKEAQGEDPFDSIFKIFNTK